MLTLELSQRQRQCLLGGGLQQGVGKGKFIPHGHAVVDCQRGEAGFGQRNKDVIEEGVLVAAIDHRRLLHLFGDSHHKTGQYIDRHRQREGHVRPKKGIQVVIQPHPVGHFEDRDEGDVHGDGHHGHNAPVDEAAKLESHTCQRIGSKR